jgi:hypothetical protein
MKLEVSRQSIKKFSNVQFHENPSSGSRVVPFGQTDMKNLIIAFRNFVNARKYEPTLIIKQFLFVKYSISFFYFHIY